ncbi:hypothetical protein H2200_013277 [Cladophialophora chaetospira]|uniref:RNase H type-1 domain-containing protein n=1 Tax=Cladophialophora chaetospira TaxID=386627 RepID=A0AA38WQ34_9EURO|nr:hypothetical protein H2200_013277 [Cladophialophora chaetospira]
MESSQRKDRRFDNELYNLILQNTGTSPPNALQYERKEQISRLRMRSTGPETCRVGVDTIVIAIDGACRGNGSPGARASYGLYFGPDSPRNDYGCLEASASHTNQAAEIRAAIEAINAAQRIMYKQGFRRDPTNLIVLQTDSSYLVHSIDRHIYKWRENDFTNSRGRAVANGEAFNTLDHLIYGLETKGIQVQFWLLPRELNQNADRLANMALDDPTGAKKADMVAAAIAASKRDRDVIVLDHLPWYLKNAVQ